MLSQEKLPIQAEGLWRKSSYSGGNGDCVEVADLRPARGVRDSKHPDRAALFFGSAEWAAFVTAARARGL
ncbi:hypothetical protein HDA32_000687 [Spinactinospora alkalitolerans]|uniref:DUF397 domain-containing protein n=1 Tax=Spinactinospora alkalitolerans TaxID=687207 RepID=A0A852TQJ9_9ACTN|nr:DUF397 domain-containing protein [Spinactinospora alkalitolerans]NYE45567.1 hypothetical protein [Spinactinospora alkalitolerans]